MAKRINVNMKSACNALVHVHRKLIEDEIEERISQIPARSGLFLTDDDEKLPAFGPVGSCEKVFSRKSIKGQDGEFHAGARIVLTKDNYGARSTGLGGAGGTKCEAIDIVAGQLSSNPNEIDSKIKSRGNFAEDGARIYLTERGNINHYFATENTDPVTSVSDNLKSGIGIKADHTLVIGRERVRILAGFGKFNGLERLVTGACGKDVTPRIEIGSIIEDEYQPAVRGENLVRYLYKMNSYIDTLAAKVNRLENDLSKYKLALASHIHIVAGAGPSAPSISAATEGLTGVREFFGQTLDGMLEEMHKAKTTRQHLGTESGILKGSPSDYILSNTVFIGK